MVSTKALGSNIEYPLQSNALSAKSILGGRVALTLIFRNSESAYSFYFYLPLCLLLGYGLCARPALNMYVYNVWCLLLAFPRLDINLDSSTACLLYSNLRVVLVDNSITRS